MRSTGGATAVGLTKDAGWELGVRRTVARPIADVWDYLLGEGLPLWLGAERLGGVGEPYRTLDGAEGVVRARTDGLRIRLTWRPSDGDHESTVQLTLRRAATGTTIALHQERLADEAERARLLPRWTAVLQEVVTALTR